MALITKREFHHKGKTYYLQRNTEGDCVRLYERKADSPVLLVFDNSLDVKRPDGSLVGKLRFHEDVVQGFINGVKVADDFDLYAAMAQFGYAYLKRRCIEDSERIDTTNQIVELERDLGMAKITIEQLRSRLETTEAAYMDLEAKYLALTKPKYGNHKIAGELIATALGDAYFGNALYVAKDIPGLTEDDRQVILRFLDGTNGGTDHVKLQDIANRIMKL